MEVNLREYHAFLSSLSKAHISLSSRQSHNGYVPFLSLSLHAHSVVGRDFAYISWQWNGGGDGGMEPIPRQPKSVAFFIYYCSMGKRLGLKCWLIAYKRHGKEFLFYFTGLSNLCGDLLEPLRG